MGDWVGHYVGPDLPKLFDQTPLDRALYRMTDKGGERMHDYIVAFTPIRTGNLATSWYRDPVDITPGRRRWKSVIATTVDYAPYVNYGTGLYGPLHRKYLIEPKDPGGTLSWIDPRTGKRTGAKRVWHTGSEGHFMIETAAAILSASLNEAMFDELERYKHAQEAMGLEAMRGVVLP